MTCLKTICELAAKVGVDLTGKLTRSEMRRVIWDHYDEKHREAYAAGLRDLIWITQADIDLLDSLEISSFRKP
jgi:hypothetical protein